MVMLHMDNPYADSQYYCWLKTDFFFVISDQMFANARDVSWTTILLSFYETSWLFGSFKKSLWI